VIDTQEMLAAIVTSSDDAIVSKDLKGTILSWNAGAERIFGYTAEEAVGRPITMLLPPDRQDEEVTILALIVRGERVAHYETERVAKDGHRVQVSLSVSPIKDASGRVVGGAKIARDISPRKRLEAEREESRAHLRLLLDVANALASNLDLSGILAAVSSSLERVIPYDFTALILHDEESDDLVERAVVSKSRHGHAHQDGRRPIGDAIARMAFTGRRAVVLGEDDLTGPVVETSGGRREAGIRALCYVPLVAGGHALGVLSVGCDQPGAFAPAIVTVMEAVANRVALAVANAVAFQKIAELKDKLAEERLYLESEIRADRNFEEIIGTSRALRDVLQQVEVVAATDATVLILGETGTGKELMARAIHERSERRERTFVKINCAAIPTGLLESELFGHERGAFTGAIAQKIGRFEVANGGTLFLDEVGEIPLELQPKLLRVLQEQEFERLGGTKTIKVDVRLVAATNRNLAEMVEERRFRDDLFYRLNVFPLSVPPLRERPEDIEALVGYFVRRFARRMKRRIDVIPQETLDAMRVYPWPGNVRELENLIERAVILSQGPRLAVPVGELASRRSPASQRSPASEHNGESTLEGVGRAHILRVLEETNWILGGPRGAAARLGTKRTTLHSLMKRLGIVRPE
jgi:formate hydrogenlyase transcriptional activator